MYEVGCVNKMKYLSSLPMVMYNIEKQNFCFYQKKRKNDLLENKNQQNVIFHRYFKEREHKWEQSNTKI